MRGGLSPACTRKEVALSRWSRVAPFLVLGPISGPLIAGVVLNLRDGRPVLAALYGLALGEFSYLLPWITAELGIRLI